MPASHLVPVVGGAGRKGPRFPKSVTHLICKVTSHIRAQAHVRGAYFKARGRSGIPTMLSTEKGTGQRTVSDRRFPRCKVSGGEMDRQGASFLQEPGASADVISRLSRTGPAKCVFTAASSHRCANCGPTRLRVFLPLTCCVTWAKPELEPRFQALNPTFCSPSRAVRHVNGVCECTWCVSTHGCRA